MPDDQAQSILAPAQADNSVKADAWQAFKDSANEREYGARLQGMNLPQDVKAQLWEAKRKMGAAVSPEQQAPNLVTGQGMERQSVQQAQRMFTGSGLGNQNPPGQIDRSGHFTRAIPPTLLEKAADEQTNNQVQLGAAQNRAMRSPTPLTNATSLYAPMPAARAIIGAKLGGYGARQATSALGGGETAQNIAELGGNILGGTAAGVIPSARSIAAKSFTPAGDLNPNSWWNLGKPSSAVELIARKIAGVSKEIPGESVPVANSPNIAAKQAAYQEARQVTEAHEAAIAQAEKISAQQRIDTARAEKAAQVARDDVLKARDQHAQDLMNRQAQQDRLDAAAARAENAAARARKEALAARDQKGQDLMNRQRQQDALDKEAARAQMEAETARNQHAQDLMNRQKQQDLLDAKHAKALKDLEGVRQKQLADNERLIQQHAEALNRRGPSGTPGQPASLPGQQPMLSEGNSQDLINRMKTIVRPGEPPSPADLKRAGDLTQVPLGKIKLLASLGDELARNELNRRIRNQ